MQTLRIFISSPGDVAEERERARQVVQGLRRRYARHFDLVPHIRTHATVERVEPTPGGGWTVSVTGREVRHYAGVVIASGHNRDPRFPEIPGAFTGTLLHACHYKSPTQPIEIAGKRVLVIGGGNSGCDIVVDCAGHAFETVLSVRRGYYLVPRFILGRPADLRGERLLKMRLPLWLRRRISLRAIDREIGLPWRHGLPRPDHRLWETHPVINGDLCRRIDSGQVRPAGDVARFDGDSVVFTDGSRAPFDVVIAATGYRVTLPFIDPEHLCADAEGVPRLFMNLLHPTRDDIAVVGLIQPDSGQWGLTDLQSKLVARMAVAARQSPRAAAWLYRARLQAAEPTPVRYLNSPRHRLEVEHFSYRRALQRLITSLDRRLRSTAG